MLVVPKQCVSMLINSDNNKTSGKYLLWIRFSVIILFSQYRNNVDFLSMNTKSQTSNRDFPVTE